MNINLLKKCFVFASIVFMLACSNHRHLKNSLPNTKYIVPPGTVEISSNLFVDKTEICNFSYLEFYWWTERVFGDSSLEFKEIIPNETVWYFFKNQNHLLIDYYFMHPTYRYYPVVGITKKQGDLFCKWRSDRVMEYILLREGIIDHLPNPSIENYFSIERYFAGNYFGIKPDISLMYYPEYTLPDTALYQQIEAYYKISNKPFQKPKYQKQLDFRINCKENIQPMLDTMQAWRPPTLITEKEEENIFENPSELFALDKHALKKRMTHLRGNVRELTSTDGVSYGGAFIDSCQIDLSKLFYKSETPNFYTGFRCICRYKKWEFK